MCSNFNCQQMSEMHLIFYNKLWDIKYVVYMQILEVSN